MHEMIRGTEPNPSCPALPQLQQIEWLCFFKSLSFGVVHFAVTYKQSIPRIIPKALPSSQNSIHTNLPEHIPNRPGALRVCRTYQALLRLRPETLLSLFCTWLVTSPPSDLSIIIAFEARLLFSIHHKYIYCSTNSPANRCNPPLFVLILSHISFFFYAI